LLEQLLATKYLYHVYIDNHFTFTKLLKLLQKRGFVAMGTCYTNARVLSELVELKKKDKGKGEMLQGT